ncbi:hypothetical protein MTR67_039729, partial [Solanum verrucosum]
TLKVRVGRGDKVLFWEEDWSGHGTLHSLFPGLFSISLNTGCSIQEMWSPQGWNLTFRRPLNDWEIPWVVDFLTLIRNFPGTNTDADKLIWRHHNDGIFTVNRVYKRGLSVAAGRSTGPWNTIWKSVAPNKVKCFTWLVARKACLTHEALQKSGSIIASRCLLCKEALETNKHFFMHCKVTTQVWAMFTSIAGINLIMPEHTAYLLSCWIRRGGSKNQKR